MGFKKKIIFECYKAEFTRLHQDTFSAFDLFDFRDRTSLRNKKQHNQKIASSILFERNQVPSLAYLKFKKYNYMKENKILSFDLD